MASYYDPKVNLEGKKVEMWRQSGWAEIDNQNNSWRGAFSGLLQATGLQTATTADSNESGESNSEASFTDDLIPIMPKDTLTVSKDVYLLMEDGFPKIATTNQVAQPFDKYISSFEDSNIGKIVNGALQIWNAGKAVTENNFNGAKWQPWIRNAPAWNGSKGISTQYTFKFALGQFGLWNAYEEVVKPIANLMAPCLPRKQKLSFAEGPWPNSTVLLARMINGAYTSIGKLFAGDTSNFLSSILTNGYSDFTWTMKFGTWMTFYHMIIENCEVSFSNKVDEAGWPVQGSIKLYLVGIVPMALQSSSSSNLAAKFGISAPSSTPNSGFAGGGYGGGGGGTW